MSPIIEDLKVLETAGINVEKYGTMHNFKGTLSMVVADNLAAHGIGGFQESFNTVRFCRFCMITKTNVKNFFRDVDLVSRSRDSFNEQAKIVQQVPDVARVYGVKRKSPLNELKYFHVVYGLPSDLAHDLFEGIVPDVMQKVITHCVREEYFTLEFLNEQIETFPYSGNDKRNKPSKMATQVGSFTVKQKAVQCWCFLRLLPLMVGSKVTVGDRVWDILTSIQDVVQVCTSPQVDPALCDFLADLIEMFLEKFFTEFPENSMKPKFHYIIHYPQLMMKFGPLVHCWSLRFEGKHLYFKELSHHTKNRRNLCKTLATRHEYYQAWMRTTRTDFVNVVEHSYGKLFPVRLLLRPIQTLLEPLLGGNESVYTCKKVQFNSTWYSEGWAVAIGATPTGFVQFGVIELCCIIGGMVYLVCKPAVNTVFVNHIHSFEITLSGDVFIVKKVPDLLDHYALGVYNSNNCKIIVPRHHIHVPEF